METIRIIFRNLEQPKQKLDFSFGDVPKGAKKKIETFHLEDGKEYDLPIEVVDHLNSLAVPIYDFREDPDTGRKKSVKVGNRQRFSCIPVNIRQQVQAEVERDMGSHGTQGQG